MYKTPAYLFKKVTFQGQTGYNTRQAAGYNAALVAAGVTERAGVRICQLDVTKSSWCWATVRIYNKLPPDLRAEKVIAKFKSRLKDWVATNIDH